MCQNTEVLTCIKSSTWMKSVGIFYLFPLYRKNRVNLICANMAFTSLFLGLHLKASKYLLYPEPEISLQFIEYGDLLGQHYLLDRKTFWTSSLHLKPWIKIKAVVFCGLLNRAPSVTQQICAVVSCVVTFQCLLTSSLITQAKIS